MKPTRTLWTALRLTLVLTVVLGIGYPLVVTAIGRVAFPAQAAGPWFVTTPVRFVGRR